MDYSGDMPKRSSKPRDLNRLAAEIVGQATGEEQPAVDIPEKHIGVVADRIVGKLTKPIEFDGRELAVGASLGVASAVSGTLDADSLVRNADVAMYVAKHGGKGRLSVFEPTEPVSA